MAPEAFFLLLLTFKRMAPARCWLAGSIVSTLAQVLLRPVKKTLTASLPMVSGANTLDAYVANLVASPLVVHCRSVLHGSANDLLDVVRDVGILESR